MVYLNFIYPIYGQTTIDQATIKVLDLINSEIGDDCLIYYYGENYSSDIVTLIQDSINVDYDSWIFFIDEHPLMNWSHDCRFLLVDKQSGNITTKFQSWPPIHLENWTLLSSFPNIPQTDKYDFSEMKKAQESGIATSNCYAVIISGGADLYNNWERYWNDCQAIYNVLVQFYGYLDNHIYVLMSDGTSSSLDRHRNDNTYDSSPLDLDGDGDNDIQFSATRNNITTVFDTLAAKLDNEDFLFIFTTDHGGQTSGDDVYLYLWGETISDVEFATEVNKVNAGHISIVMEQCYSGGFISDLSKLGRTISTACTANQQSAALPNMTYDEFVYHWIAAVSYSYPGGTSVNCDYDNDGYISMQEAFDYASSADTRPFETPQYNAIKNHLGDYVTLNGTQACSLSYLLNWVITTDQSFTDCNIFVRQVNIQNNSNLILDAAEKVLIMRDFSTEIGSTLYIK